MTPMFKLRRLAGTAILALVCAQMPVTPGLAQLTLNVRDADIRAFIQDAARNTGRTFIIDSRVQGKVSVVTDRSLTRSEYFEIFLSTLRANGLVAVPSAGGAFRIQPVEGAAGQPGPVGQAANRNQFVTEVIRLRSIDAQSALDTLRPLVSKDGSITANRSGRSLVVADYADNIARIRRVLAQVDTDGSSTALIPLKNAGAREIATSLQTLVGGGGEGAAANATIVAIDSSNSIAIRGDATSVARLSNMVRDLDKRAESGTEIRVYWLQNADADKMLPVLQQLLGQASAPITAASSAGSSAGNGARNAGPAETTPVAATTGEPGTGINGRGAAVVTRYEGANAVIVAASGDTQRMLGEVIRQLDTRREQVLVEAIIVEIGNNAARKLGVQFLLGSTKTGFAATNYSNASPNLLTLAGAIGATKLGTQETVVVAPDGTKTTTTTTENSGLANQLQSAAVETLQNATGGFGGVATQLGRNGILGAIINAVQSDTESNVLSTPSITTLDNQQAHMLVGQEVPVATGEALSPNFDNQFRTVQRQNVGIMLDVTPQINAGGTIKLFIKQEVSSVAGPVSNDSSDLIINKRQFETTVLVDDGDILALGGLLDDNERRTIEKIPLLGDLPVLGNLFKSRSRARTKTNLMVFIRPTILTNKADAQEMTARRYGYIRGRQALANPGAEPSIDELVRDYMGAALPVSGPQTGDQVIDGRVVPIEATQSQQVVRPTAEPADTDDRK
ncbi:MAG: type II secretion system protein GspD [Sphingobium sp. 66-54]|mgnify:CR=1 FL=1|nr:MAG: type II secretion system protein GspD [Sphingobium sp. 66-54]